MPADFSFTCKTCGVTMTAKREWIGRKGQCKVCGSPLTVPEPDCGIEFLDEPVASNAATEPAIGAGAQIQSSTNANTSPSDPGSETPPDPGYLYVLMNSSMPGLLKIGKTGTSPENRAAELSGATGVATPFVVAYFRYVANCSIAEEYIHTHLELSGHRVADNREFFRASLNEVISLIDAGPGTAVGNPTVPSLETYGPRLRAGKEILEEVKRTKAGAARAVACLQEAIELGSAEACFLLSEIYCGQYGIPLDVDQRIRYLKEGAARGNAECYSTLGTFHEHGVGSMLASAEKAIRCYEQAARLGHLYSYELLAEMYFRDGHAVKKDLSQAMKWAEEGANRGSLECYAIMSELYCKLQDYDNAEKCWALIIGSELFKKPTTHVSLSSYIYTWTSVLKRPLRYRHLILQLDEDTKVRVVLDLHCTLRILPGAFPDSDRATTELIAELEQGLSQEGLAKVQAQLAAKLEATDALLQALASIGIGAGLETQLIAELEQSQEGLAKVQVQSALAVKLTATNAVLLGVGLLGGGV